jgi:4a-hydroxytetrahydrobiopterin dehydratase
MPKLTAKQISLQLKAVPGWTKHALTIHRTFEFDGFLEGIDFVNQIAKKAQRADHHPDIDIRYNKVTLTLTTHDEGGLTDKDFSLAKQCDEVFAKFGELRRI